MSTPTVLVSNQTNTLVDTPEKFYTDDGNANGTRIDAFNAANPDTINGVTASYKAYIVDAGGNPVNPQKPFQFVVWGEIDLGLGLVNQLIPSGGSLQMESSATGRIYFTVSGTKV